MAKKNGTGKKIFIGIAIGIGTVIGAWFIKDAAITYAKARNINVNLLENALTKEEHKEANHELEQKIQQERNARIMKDKELSTYFVIMLTKYDTIMSNVQIIRMDIEELKRNGRHQ
jgi:hypothetical protein